MENERNKPSRFSRSGDKGIQPMVTPEEETPGSSGINVDPFPKFLSSVEAALGRNRSYALFRFSLYELMRRISVMFPLFGNIKKKIQDSTVKDLKAFLGGHVNIRAVPWRNVHAYYRGNSCNARSKIEEILKEHQELLTEFKILFPEGEVLNLPQHVDDYEKAFQFLYKVEDCFQGDERFRVFLKILNAFKNGTKNSQEVYNEIKGLFIDQPDLLQEFATEFLPSTQAARDSR